MNILFVSHSDSLGGANQSLIHLIKGLKKYNYGITVLIPKGTGEIIPVLEGMDCDVMIANYHRCVRTGIEIRPFIKHFANRTVIRDICNVIEKKQGAERIHLIHSNGSICDVGALISKKLGVPHIWHVRENVDFYNFSFLYPLMHRRLLQNSTVVICISKYIEKYAKEKYGLTNTIVIYNGFDIPDKEMFSSRRDGCKEDVNGICNIIIAGAIYKNKGHEDALRALSIIKKEYKVRQVRLLIVGTQETTKDQEERIRNLAQALKIENDIELLPFCGSEELSLIREKCDIALQCSIKEGMGRVTIESMLEKLLVIGARSGATEELITDGYNGWLYEPGNSRHLAEKIYQAIMCKDRERIREDAFKWAAENYSNERITEQFVEVYKDLYKKNMEC